MIESSMFDCPPLVLEKGLLACACMQRARDLLLSLKDEASESYVAPLDTLRSCYEASLWAAVDYHGLSQLQDHYLSSLRTSALLARAREEILPLSEDDRARLHELLEEALQAVDEGGLPCAVRQPTTLTGSGPAQSWESRMREALEGLEEDSSDSDESSSRDV